MATEIKSYNQLLSSSSVDGIRVVACPRPFSTVRVDRVLPAGGSISDILKALGVDPKSEAHVLIGDILVRREHWHRVKPKIGHTVTVRVVPTGGNGGKTALRVLIGIVGAVAGYFTGGVGAGAVWGTSSTIGGVSVTAIGAAAGSAIGGALGNYAGMALIPPPKPKQPSNLGIENSPTIAGSGNRIAPYEPIPKIFGRHRVIPPARIR